MFVNKCSGHLLCQTLEALNSLLNAIISFFKVKFYNGQLSYLRLSTEVRNVQTLLRKGFKTESLMCVTVVSVTDDLFY